MATVKEIVVKAALWLLRSKSLPIWGHTPSALSKTVGLWGIVIAARFTLPEQHWERVSGQVFSALLIGTSCMAILWLAIAVAHYCEYRRFPRYQKMKSVVRQLNKFLWRGAIVLTVSLTVLGVIFGVGT